MEQVRGGVSEEDGAEGGEVETAGEWEERRSQRRSLRGGPGF